MKIINRIHPEYRKSKLYELPKKNPNYGLDALNRIEINKEKLFHEYFDKIKKDFLEEAITSCKNKNYSYNIKTLVTIDDNGHLEEFLRFARKNNVQLRFNVFGATCHQNVTILYVVYIFLLSNKIKCKKIYIFSICIIFFLFNNG